MVKSIALLLPIYVTFMWAMVFLFQKKAKGKANTVLGLFMLLASLLYCSHAIYFHQLYHLYSFVDSLYLMILLTLYPLFYAYILLLTGAKINFSRFLLHFLPAVFVGVVSVSINLALSPEQRVIYVKQVLMEHNLKGLDPGTLTEIKGMIFLAARIYFVVQILFYITLGIRLANRHNNQIRDYYSEIEGRRMNWVRDISIIILIVSVMGIVLTIIGRGYFTRHEIFLLIPSLTFSTIYFVIGFNGNKQLAASEEVFQNVNDRLPPNENLESKQKKLLKKNLLDLFEKQKIHRMPDLRITTICEALQTNRTYISRLINDEFGINFNQFVNKFRVIDAEELMKNKDHDAFTLDYIAEKSGFGSTNSFNRAFKEYKGITPGTYREKVKAEQLSAI